MLSQNERVDILMFLGVVSDAHRVPGLGIDQVT